MATFIKTTFKSTFHKLLQPILIKEIQILDLRWLQTKSDLLVFLRFKIIKTILIRIKEIISTKIEDGQPPVYQAQPYQAPAQQVQGVSKTDFENYVKANDAVLRNMQNQGQGLQNQIANLIDMLSKFVNANTTSSWGTGTLPSNTVTNPKEDLKGITIRSGVAYKGPTIPIPITSSSPKVVERETEVTKDTMHPTNNGSTENVPPLVVPIVNRESISEPANALVSALRPNQKASIPFPSRRND
ncbi:hypothetical protein Tco_0131642, partial [Tanacetum coccineum]